MTPTPRLVLAGNNTAAILTLDLALETMPPRDVLCLAPHGGRHHAWQPSLATAARERGVRVLEPADVNAPEVVEDVRTFGAGLLLSVYYTQIFRRSLLDAVDGACLNVHPSLLPRHRGVAPLVWAIVEGDDKTGVTVHHIDDAIDTGRIVWQQPLPIHRSDTGHELHEKAARLVSAACAELLRGWLRDGGVPEGWEQSGRATHHTLRDPQVNHLDFADGRARIRDIVRALAPPLPGAYCHAPDGRTLLLSRVTPVPAAGDGLSRSPGYVEMLLDGWPVVWAADGPLRIDTFVTEGREHAGRALAEVAGVLEGDLLA